MNICYVVPALVHKAPVIVALRLAAEMTRLGNYVEVWYFDKDVETSLPSGVVHRHVKFGLISKKEAEKSCLFDVVHSHMLRPDMFVFLNKNKFPGAVFISTLHNYFVEDLRNRYSFIFSAALAFLWNLSWLRHDRLVSLSRHGVDYYKRMSINKSVCYAYNGVKLDPELPLEPRYVDSINILRSKCKVLLGSYCVVSNSKGLEAILPALARNIDYGLVVIGDGPAKSALIREAFVLGVSDRCVFLPSIPNAYLYNVFFDIYAMPSRSEGFGLALIEAALYEKKIICSDIPIFRELFDSSAVTYFSLDNGSSLDKAITIALCDDIKPANARAKAEDSYSVTRMGRQYVDIYRAALRESH